MGGDSLTRADCYVLPSLQHIRVAGKVRRSGLALPFLGCFAWLQCIDAAYGRYNVICVCVGHSRELYNSYYYYTHLTASFFRTTWVSRYQKGSTSLDLNEACQEETGITELFNARLLSTKK